MPSEALAHFETDNVVSTGMKAKFRLRGWLSRHLGHSTFSKRLETVAKSDASTSTNKLARYALSVPGHEDRTCVSAAIHNVRQQLPSIPCYIAQLPVEILIEIFVHCLPLGLYGDQYPSPRIEDAPMLLCRVCRHWRQVAFSLTMLWSSFSSRCQNLNSWFETSHDSLSLVQCFLDRSRDHPISIEFGDGTLPSVRQLLYANFHRWRRACVEPNAEVVKELLGLPTGVATSLESLSMCIGYDCEATLHEIPAILPLFPNLRRLHFDSILSPNSLLPNIPWSQLTHLRLFCEVPMDECAKFLRQCGQAQYIQIAGICPSGPIIPASATLPYLRHLDIASADDIAILLDHLTLPSLHSLRFTTMPRTRRNFRAIEDLASRSLCELKVLRIDDIDMLEEDLVGYLTLPCLRSLEELEIFNFYNIRDRTLSLLLYPGTSSGDGILPNLKRLKLQNPFTSDGLFSDMIQSRWGSRHSPVSLEHVSVEFPRSLLQQRGQFVPPHDMDVLRFTEFAEQGLSITWKWC